MTNDSDIRTIIAHYAQETKARVAQLEEIARNSPQGSLVIKTINSNKYYYKMSSDNGQKTTQYIKPSQKELISQLADKRFARQVLPNLRSNLRAAESFLKYHSGLEECSLEAFIGRDLSAVCSSKCMPQKAMIDKWLSESWTETPYQEYPPTHPTLKGLPVRSKSEVMIANSLFQHGIPYHYEKPLFYSPNRAPIFPDFSILHPDTCELWFWEHFGLIDNPLYFDDMCRKFEIFQSQGITPGHRLICTFECEKHPLSSVLINDLIQFHFGK